MKVRTEIESSKRDIILAQLRRRKPYSIRRGGCRIRMWSRSGPEGLRVHYQLFPKRGISVTGAAWSVKSVIDQVNEVLRVSAGAPEAQHPRELARAFVEAPVDEQRMPPAPPDPWLPYKDE